MKNLIAKWQTILDIEDWDINVEIVPEGEITGYDKDDWKGETEWDMEEKTAEIKLTEARESKLVHELVHILFNPIDTLSCYVPADVKLAVINAEDLAVEKVAQMLIYNFGGNKKGE